MEDTPEAPAGWFVRTELNHDGTVVLTAMIVLGDRRESKSGSWTVTPTVPWWRFFAGSFEKRLQRSTEAAQKRAWTLNQQFKRAKRLTYDLQVKTRKENPHDD